MSEILADQPTRALCHYVFIIFWNMMYYCHFKYSPENNMEIYIMVFGVVTKCNFIISYQRFGGTYYLLIQGSRGSSRCWSGRWRWRRYLHRFEKLEVQIRFGKSKASVCIDKLNNVKTRWLKHVRGCISYLRLFRMFIKVVVK